MGTISRCDDFQLRYPDCEGYNPAEADRGGIVSNDIGEAPVPCDYFGGVYDYIKKMLMEEDDLDHRPCMFQDCSALQAAEKYFFDALCDQPSPPPQHDHTVASASSFHPPSFLFDSHAQFAAGAGASSTISCDFTWLENNGSFQVVESLDQDSGNFQALATDVQAPADQNGRVKKTRGRGDDGECGEERGSKQMAGYAEESIQMEKYDKSLLCPKMNPRFYDDCPPGLYEDSGSSSSDSDVEMKKQYRKTKEVKRGRPKGSKKNRKVSEVVDLRSLLTRCAEAVSSFNMAAGESLLKQIRKHSSPYGDANERLAHCFANALEARMTGTGSALYTASAARRIPASELLKSYQSYVTSCPFKRMSNIFANKSIAKNAKDSMKIHIIDFGIFYGFQWPCIIHGLSLKPGGPPTLKITGIDYPQPGFKPAERVEQTGRRLADFCKRFNVSFEYNAIAKKWEDIKLEDLNIERDETVVVNCLYRLRHVSEEYSATAGASSPSPRDAVLSFVKKINPALFVHGVVNGSYNAAFFGTRFKEAVFHYSSLFDMMEATLPREDEDRLLYEREVFGRDVMNVIACEGAERVERPESYKQWQVRNQRAGLVQVPLAREIVAEVKAKVRSDYHSDFMVEEDSGWLLQGWKGRVMYALSCWKPLPG